MSFASVAATSSWRWRPILDRSFPLDREGAVEAHHYLHARENLGKVVLEG